MPDQRAAVVTGGAGFIGSHVVDRLSGEGYRVTVIDDLSSGKAGNVAAQVELVAADVASPAARAAIARAAPSLVVHAAAQISVSASTREPLEDARVNVLGTVNMLEAVRAAGNPGTRVVFIASGGTAYGQPERLPVDETAAASPENPYGASKLSGEVYLGMYRRAFGLRSSALRLANVYGPRQDPHGEAGVVAIFTRAMLAGQPVTIFGDGNDERDYVFVDDVVEAVMAASDNPGAPPVCNIGTGVGTSVNRLCEMLTGLTGYRKGPVYAPPRPGDIHAIRLDPGLAEREMAWTPSVSLPDGLARTVAYFRERGPA